MNKKYFRLQSTVPGGFGGPQTKAFNLIYAHMLRQAGLGFYSGVFVMQIDRTLNELVQKRERQVHINLIYPVDPLIHQKDELERNLIRLDFVHQGMLRLANWDKRFNVEKLEDIKAFLIEKKFVVDLSYKSRINKKDPSVKAAVVFNPSERFFSFFLVFEKEGKEIFRQPVGEIITSEYYESRPYYDGGWVDKESFLLVNSLTGEEFTFGLGK